MRSIRVVAALALPVVLGAQSSYLSYSSYLGGNGIEVMHAIATDAAGNVYLTGETTSTNFPGAPASNLPPPVNIFGLTGAPQPSAFVTKLSQAGQLVYTKLLGSGGATAGLGIAVDKTVVLMSWAAQRRRTFPLLRAPIKLQRQGHRAADLSPS